MDITDYTSYDEVRSVCGMSADELPDAELGLGLYASVLSLSLVEVSVPLAAPGPGPLSTRFLEIEDILEAERTVKEQTLYDLTKVFCTYVVAFEAVTSLSMKAPKVVTDSKFSYTRFSPESVYKDVIKRLGERVSDLKSSIEEINADSAESLSFLRVIEPSVDPVTGETT